MRAALIALSVLLAAAVLAATSGADTPARARAQATVVSGSLGDFGALEARGDDEQSDDSVTVDTSGVKVGRREDRRPQASRSQSATARASSLARRIDLLDGLVTATAARRTATAAGGKTIHSGRVTGLTLEGRRVGDVTKNRAYLLSDASSVAVNRGKTALDADPRQRPRLAAEAHEDPRRHRDRDRRGRRHQPPPPPRRRPPRPPRRSPKRRRRPSASAPPRSPSASPARATRSPSTARRPPPTTSAPPAPTPASTRATTSSPPSAPPCSPSPTAPSTAAARLPSPATASGSTPRPATPSSTPTSPPSPPTPRTVGKVKAGVGVEPQAVAGDGERADAVDGVRDASTGAPKGANVVALMDAGVGAGRRSRRRGRLP